MLKLTYIYAMLNSRNGYVKIGRSDNPAFREKTLQSEEPEVELLFAYLCRPEVELEMHFQFADKRLRGEWFRLDEDDIFALDEIMAKRSLEFRISRSSETFWEIVNRWFKRNEVNPDEYYGGALDAEIDEARAWCAAHPESLPQGEVF